jgi:hypothetical protein
MGQITLGFFPEESIELFRKNREKWLATPEGVAIAFREVMDLTARFFYQDSVSQHIEMWIEVLVETRESLLGSSCGGAIERAHRELSSQLAVLLEQLKGLLVMKVVYSADKLLACSFHGPLIRFISKVGETNLVALESHFGRGSFISTTKGKVNNLMDAGLVKRSIDGVINLTPHGRAQFKRS